MISKRRVFAFYFVVMLSFLSILGGASIEASSGISGEPSTDLFFMLDEPGSQERGGFRAEWNYTFLRGNRSYHVFDAPGESLTLNRSAHRKLHLVDWQLKYGLTDVWQAEGELVYKAYRQAVFGDGEKGNIDDGDFDRIFTGLSYQLLPISAERPSARIRGGIIWPNRSENEDIGQEAGIDLMGVSSYQVGSWIFNSNLGFSFTFNNHSMPSDIVFEKPPRSKEHDFRTLTYGIGAARALNENWQANLELDGVVFDTIELSQRVSRSLLRFTPGIYYTTDRYGWNGWLGFGMPFGISSDAAHIGFAIRTGMVF